MEEAPCILLVEDGSVMIPPAHQHFLETNPNCRVHKTSPRQLKKDYCAKQNYKMIIIPLGLKDKIGTEVLQEIHIPIIEATGENIEFFKKAIHKNL
jgi:hypothetical protein